MSAESGEGTSTDVRALPAPRRILFFDHTAELGGGEIALLNLVVALDQSRFTPVVVLAANGPLRERLEGARIQTVVLPLSQSVTKASKDRLGGKSLLQMGTLWRILSYVIRLRRLVRECRADLMHTNSLKADIIGGVAGRLAGVRVLWHVRDRIADDYLPHRVVRVFRWLCRRLPNAIVANSHATMSTLCLPPHRVRDEAREGGNGNCNNGNCYVVHDGVPDCVIQTPVSGPTADRMLIGLVGRISPWKGQHIFIEAAEQVRRRFPQARFQIIGAPLFGEEGYANQVRRRATELGLDDCLEFTGFRTDVPELIRSLTILVHASTIGEPFGQVVIEGMVAAKPVIATNGGGVPEIVQDGTTGLLVPMGDAEALAQAVERLLLNPEGARSMGAAGRERVLNHFTVAHTARKIEKVYDNVLNPRRDFPVMSKAHSQVQS